MSDLYGLIDYQRQIFYCLIISENHVEVFGMNTIKRKKQIPALILSISMFLGLFSGCSEKKNDAGQSSASEVTTESQTSEMLPETMTSDTEPQIISSESSSEQTVPSEKAPEEKAYGY